jgi:integrase
MSTRTRRTHLRDDDPVRVYASGAVRYWTGGVPGQGERLPKKFRTESEAQAWAVGKRKELARRRGADPKVDSRLVDAFQEMLNTMTATGVVSSSIRQYKSNWNVWIAPVFKGSACADAQLPLWTKVFDEALKPADSTKVESPRRTRPASKTTIDSLERTLNTFISWAEERGYFLVEAPFGSAVRRRKVAKAARKLAREPDSREGLMDGVVLDFYEVEKYAIAYEEQYPGYGYKLVLTSFSTGLRIAECLALKDDSIDPATGDVFVDWQLDRDHHWPAVKPPKGDKPRVATMWESHRHIAEELIASARDRDPSDPEYGWLFPRHRSDTAWADQASKLAKAAAEATGQAWRFHALRHANATYTILPEVDGGQGKQHVQAAAWAGHSSPAFFFDTYVDRVTDDIKEANAAFLAAGGWDTSSDAS